VKQTSTEEDRYW